ncbi:MAG: TadE/TadG family type IV pilus assembly protein [Allopontixanthobacter sediminis]
MACKPQIMGNPIGRARRAAAQALRDPSAVAMVEFAFVAPILLLLGMAGMELANFAIVKLRLGQAAVHIADNVSRVGDRDILAAQRIFESDLNDLFIGVNLQAGDKLDIYEHGRIIVSSLERNADGGQWIAWQRCKGKKNFVSEYGDAGTGASGTGFPGMGRSGEEVTAEAGTAVMFVEISYTYQPLLVNGFTRRFIEPFEMSASAAYNVRNSRDLTGIFQTNPASPVSDCDTYDAIP